MEKNKHLYIYTLIVFSPVFGRCSGLVKFERPGNIKIHRNVVGYDFYHTHYILWVYCDAGRSDFEKPFDFGFLVYIFWPVALPWYLVSTRGVEGVLIFLGFIALWIGPWLMGLVAYVYFSP